MEAQDDIRLDKKMQKMVLDRQLGFCRNFPHLDAEDLAQQTFLVVQEKIRGGAAPLDSNHFMFWTLNVARNVFHEARKGAQRDSRIDRHAAANRVEQGSYQGADEIEHLQAALGRLPSPERMILELRFLSTERVTLCDAARLLRVSPATAERLEKRALGALRLLFDSEG